MPPDQVQPFPSTPPELPEPVLSLADRSRSRTPSLARVTTGHKTGEQDTARADA